MKKYIYSIYDKKAKEHLSFWENKKDAISELRRILVDDWWSDSETISDGIHLKDDELIKKYKTIFPMFQYCINQSHNEEQFL